MKLTYLGQCGFLIETAGVRIVTDPFLANDLPGWKREYPAPCTLQDLNPDLVVISHSHNDHMNQTTLQSYRSVGGDCFIAAPAPECALLYEIGFSHVVEARAEQPFTVGNVHLTPIMCAHTEPHTDDAGRFRELSYMIESPEGTLFFGGDLSLYDGLVQRILRNQPSHLILPCNGRDEERTAQNIIGNTTCTEAAQLAKDCSAVLIPAHYDLFLNNGCPLEEIQAAADQAGVKLLVMKLNEPVALA